MNNLLSFFSFQFDTLHIFCTLFQLPATLYLYIRKELFVFVEWNTNKSFKNSIYHHNRECLC